MMPNRWCGRHVVLVNRYNSYLIVLVMVNLKSKTFDFKITITTT